MNNEIKEHLKEGQTQVYSDGRIDPQYGVNTNAPYLNNPRLLFLLFFLLVCYT
jgi:hypothetical protein